VDPRDPALDLGIDPVMFEYPAGRIGFGVQKRVHDPRQHGDEVLRSRTLGDESLIRHPSQEVLLLEDAYVGGIAHIARMDSRVEAFGVRRRHCDAQCAVRS